MNCKEGTLKMTQQIDLLLNAIHSKAYSKPLEAYNGGSLGQHFRHIIDFYDCLYKGAVTGVVDYSARERNAKIEQDKTLAQSVLTNLLENICGLDEAAAIKVKTDFSADVLEDRPIVNSTIGREMLFAYDHAIHHLAIIRIGIQTNFPEIELEEQMGIAPSTIKHRVGEKATSS